MSRALILLSLLFAFTTRAQSPKAKILIVGFDHLSQVYKEGNPHSDVLTEENQKSINEFAELISRFSPDMIGVEELPKEQDRMDSLFALYNKNKLDYKKLEYPRREIYQVAFRVGKTAGLEEITCVNSRGGTSQSILDNGENIDIYENETKELHKLVGSLYGKLYTGKLSFKDYLIFLNQPEAYKKLYRLKYLTPARVRNGTFTNPDEMVDTTFIEPEYIGAELISIFRNRDYKIYSNIVVNQMKKDAKRILIIVGVGHVGSLKSMFGEDYEYEVIDANTYLKK
mgnify:CR=1 FL=1|tara:strand:- start:5286 stop:6137 length:852 start_codon:yes stop_codon:yes gene_type:complete